MVPRVKNLAALSAAGKLNRAACKYRIKRVTSKVKKGRVVRSTPAAGRSTTGTVTLFVSKGKKHAHSASAAQYAAAETRMRAAAAFGLDR
jgi:beta-lactam-binding protein with PASTA domain